MISRTNGRAAHAGLFEQVSKRVAWSIDRGFAHALIGK
jgi:hypothetical protein